MRTLMIFFLAVAPFASGEVTTEAPRNVTVKKPKESGHVCVINKDCDSDCCIYANTISGRCMPRAPVGLVCGFVLSAGVTVDDHYRICEDCDTFCCCGVGCCPTSYCVSALDLKPKVCVGCNTGCCCNDDTCCPVQYCAMAPGLHEVQGDPCTRCPSGCCCGETCCLSSFCKGSTLGQYCQECASGCCCGKICCANQSLSMHGLHDRMLLRLWMLQ